MKILLIYPEYPETFWGFQHALKFINKKAGTPPLGLLTIASMLGNEHELKLIDMNVNKITGSDILWADYVFISAMITQRESSEEIIKKCKDLKAKIVAGGPLFSNLYEEFPDVDYFLLNETERTLPLFMEDLKKGNPKKIYISDEKPDIEAVPIPKWELINLDDYARMALQFSRGCPFNCEFCNIVTLNGRIPRVKSTKQFMAELNSLYDAGWRSSIFIVDDNFIGNKVKVKELLRELIKWRKERHYKGTFMTQLSINLADNDELLLLMRDAGFSSVFIGIETPSQEALSECGKAHNQNRDMVADIKKIHNHGMEVYGGFIVGFDSDDETIFERQLKFIQETGIVVAMVGLLNAYPGTKLYNRLKNEKRLTEQSTANNTDFTINFVPKINKELLINEYRKLLLSLYNVENYYNRIFNFLKDYKRHTSGKITRNFVIGFFKEIWHLGILDKNRSYFWKMFLICLFKYPKTLPKTLMQTAYFAHFEKIFSKEIYTEDVQESILIPSEPL